MEKQNDRQVQRFAHSFYYPTISMLKQEVYSYGFNPITKVLLIYSSQGVTLYSSIDEKIIKCKSLQEMFNEPNQHALDSISCFPLVDVWVMLKSKKSILITDSSLDKYYESPHDTSYIAQLQLDQKNEDVYTLGKDMKSIKLWSLLRPDKKKKEGKPIFLSLTLKRAIFFNYPLSSLQIAPELNTFIIACNTTREICVWERSLQRYSYVIKADTNKKAASGSIEGSNDPKKVQLQDSSKNKPIEFTLNSDIVISATQEFVYSYTNFNKKLLIWNLINESPVHCAYVGIDNIQEIRPQLTDSNSGTILLDKDLTLYDCNITNGTILGKMRLVLPNTIESHSLFDMPVTPIERAQYPLKMEVYIKNDGTEGIIINHNKSVQFIDFLTKSQLCANIGNPITNMCYRTVINNKGEIRNQIEITDDSKGLYLYDPKIKKITQSIEFNELPFAKENTKAADIMCIHYDLTYLLILGVSETGYIFVYNGNNQKTVLLDIGKCKFMGVKIKADAFCSDKITEDYLTLLKGKDTPQLIKLTDKYIEASIIIASNSGILYHLIYNVMENTLKLVKKFSAQSAITCCQIVEEGDSFRVIMSIKDGSIEIFKFCKQLSYIGKISAMKSGISTFGLTKEGLNVVGYDNGTIHSHPLENINIQNHFKVHEYHTSQIVHIVGIGSNKFISTCQKMKVAIWSVSDSLPLKVCQFSEPIRSMLSCDNEIYIGISDYMVTVNLNSISDPLYFELNQWLTAIKERESIISNIKKSKSSMINSITQLTQSGIEQTKKLWEDSKNESILPRLYKSLLGMDKYFFMTLLEMEFILYQKGMGNSQLYYLKELQISQKKSTASKEKKKKVTKLVVNFDDTESNIDFKKI